MLYKYGILLLLLLLLLLCCCCCCCCCVVVVVVVVVVIVVVVITCVLADYRAVILKRRKTPKLQLFAAPSVVNLVKRSLAEFSVVCVASRSNIKINGGSTLITRPSGVHLI